MSRCIRRTGTLAALIVAAVAVGMLARPARAHFDTLGFSRIVVEPAAVAFTLYLDPYAVDTIVDLDRDGDGTITSTEVDAEDRAVESLAVTHVHVRADGRWLEPQVGDARLTTVGAEDLRGLRVDPPEQLPVIAVSLRFAASERFADLSVGYDLYTLDGTSDHVNEAVVVLPNGRRPWTFDAAHSVVDSEVMPGMTGPEVGPGPAAATASPGDAVTDEEVGTSAAEEARLASSRPTAVTRWGWLTVLVVTTTVALAILWRGRGSDPTPPQA